MNCRNAFQIQLNIENCMTNRASLWVIKRQYGIRINQVDLM